MSRARRCCCCCRSTSPRTLNPFSLNGLPFLRLLVPPASQCCRRLSMSKGVARVGGYTYPDGSIYVGGWSEEGQRQGFGHLCLPDESRYVGCFQRGLCSGLGVLVFADGARYEGELMEGWFHGHGVFTRGDGMKYEGEFRGGKLWGWGELGWNCHLHLPVGLVTFRDLTHGFPRQEGFFQDCRLVRNGRCTEVIERAQKVAFLARAQAGL